MRRLTFTFSCIALCGFIIAQASVGARRQGDTEKKVSCEEALKNSGELKVGMTEAQVLELLGTPTARKDNLWGYSFMDCVTLPPRVGQQLITGVELTFDAGAVKQIQWLWIDAIGPAPASPQKKQKKGRRMQN